MTSYADVMQFLNNVEANLYGDKLQMKGGGNSTEPYSSYETFLNNIFGYTKFIFVNNETNKKDLSDSIELLDQCKMHKEEICKDDSSNDIDNRDTMEISPIENDDNTNEDKYQGVLLLKGSELE